MRFGNVKIKVSAIVSGFVKNYAATRNYGGTSKMKNCGISHLAPKAQGHLRLRLMLILAKEMIGISYCNEDSYVQKGRFFGQFDYV